MQRQTRNSRRQTLGSVSVNQGNRRKSVDPNNGPSSSKSRPPRGRASMIPRVGRENQVPPTPPSASTKKVSSSNRRSSVGGRKSIVPQAAPSKPDPRPVSDNSFQQDCIRKLVHFLVEKGYEHPISPKSLARPSGRDFSNVVTFMLRRIDPNFGDGSMKMEDEISMNFKALGYPFPVSKTALVAAGSPHTWPTLLAALAWLMERIQCIESMEPEDDDSGHYESLEELEIKTDKVFFKYLGAAYTAFLRGDEAATEELENGLADRFERDDTIIEQEIEQMTDRNSEIVERINHLAIGDEDLEEFAQKREGYVTDLEQFHDLIQQMEKHVATLTQKKKDRIQELEDTNRKLSRTTTRVEDLKKSISEQTLSVEDVQKMQNEIKGVNEAIDRAVDLRDQRRTQLWESESEVGKLLGELESHVSDYNALLSELSLLPLLTSKGINMKTSVNKDMLLEEDESQILGVDHVTTVQPTLLSCKQEYMEKLSDSKWKYQGALDKLEQSEGTFTEALEKLKIIESKMEKCEETLVGEREAQEAKLSVREREAESMESKVASLRDPVALEEQMAQFERQCAELEAMRMKYEEDNVARKKSVCDEIQKACLEMQKYDDFCSEKVSEVQEYRKKKEEAYEELQVPSVLSELDSSASDDR